MERGRKRAKEVFYDLIRKVFYDRLSLTKGESDALYDNATSRQRVLGMAEEVSGERMDVAMTSNDPKEQEYWNDALGVLLEFKEMLRDEEEREDAGQRRRKRRRGADVFSYVNRGSNRKRIDKAMQKLRTYDYDKDLREDDARDIEHIAEIMTEARMEVERERAEEELSQKRRELDELNSRTGDVMYDPLGNDLDMNVAVWDRMTELRNDIQQLEMFLMQGVGDVNGRARGYLQSFYTEHPEYKMIPFANQVLHLAEHVFPDGDISNSRWNEIVDWLEEHRHVRIMKRYDYNVSTIDERVDVARADRDLLEFIYGTFRVTVLSTGSLCMDCGSFYAYIRDVFLGQSLDGYARRSHDWFVKFANESGRNWIDIVKSQKFCDIAARVFGADTYEGARDVGYVKVRDGKFLEIVRAVDRLAEEPGEKFGFILIRDLKIVLMMFVMFFMGNPEFSPLGSNNIFFDVYPRVTDGQQQIEGRLYRDCGVWNNVQSQEGFCLWTEFMFIFDRMYGTLKDVLFGPDGQYGNRWEEAESGDLYIYFGGAAGGDLICELMNVNSGVHEVATKWKDKFGEMLEDFFPDGGVVTVRNMDCLCFVYMAALGMCRSSDRFALRVREKVLTVERLTKLIMEQEGNKEAKEVLKKFTDPSNPVVKNIEEQVGKCFCLKPFISVMEGIENDIIPEGYRIDVYILDPGKSKRIFPVYNSSRDGIDVKLLILRDGTDCHFCYISDARKAFRSTGGKIFQTCSKCHQSFFTQKMMDLHVCKNDKADKNWHWSDGKEHDESECVGMCSKCHLQFFDPYEYEHHQKHCFMRGRRGTRYIHLAEDPWLHGKPVTKSENAVDRMCFADFECTISPETGEHSFMSYGFYDCKMEEFKIGYDLGEFMKLLVDRAMEGKHLKVYFHNAMGYDANFILRYVLSHHNDFRDWGIRTIMKSASRMERLSFMFNSGGEVIPGSNPVKRTPKKKHIIEIGDTLHFIGMSLDKIVKSVRKDTVEGNKEIFPFFFTEFKKAYPNVSEEEIDNVLKKNLFPYNFFQNPNDLNCPMSIFRHIFAPIDANLLNFGESVTISDLTSNLPNFEHIVEVFECKDARAYHNLYLMCDVMQIADVFIQMRQTFMDVLKVDLNDYMGMPSAAWEAFLRFNPSLKLPLYKSVWFQEFFTDDTRGGVTLAPKRYGKATDTLSYIYIDKNGLYPDEMMRRKYPMGELIRRRFCDDIDPFAKRTTNAPLFNAMSMTPQGYLNDVYFPWLERHNKGCVISVDLHITKELAMKTDQFPFAPTHEFIQDDYFDEKGEYYEYLKRWSEANDGERIPPFKGLVATLYDKKEYHVHWKLLWWYMKHGMEVTKLHECVEFDEGDYLKGFIQRNVEQRNKYTDPMHKMLWKLPSNASYGKTFENTLNRADFIIVRNADVLRALIERTAILSIAPIDADNSVVRLDGDEVVLDKPTYIGACITEYAKLSMYEAFYDQLPKMFSKVELIYTDTDSFIIGVEHPKGWGAKEIFEHMNKVCPGFLGNIGGQWKSETGDDLIDEVIALRSKVYAYRTKSGKIGKRAKGTTAAAQQKELDWEAYKRALIELRAIPVANVMFKRQAFKISTEEVMKRALSGNDGKRIIEPDGIHTHAIGYNRFFK